VESEGNEKHPSESEVKSMNKHYCDSGGYDIETAEILYAISRVSARMARNISLLAAQRQSKEGGKRHEQKCPTWHRQSKN